MGPARQRRALVAITVLLRTVQKHRVSDIPRHGSTTAAEETTRRALSTPPVFALHSSSSVSPLLQEHCKANLRLYVILPLSTQGPSLT